jgi:hypothetical protein
MQEVAAVEKYKALAEPAEMVAVEQVVVMVMAALLNKHTVVLEVEVGDHDTVLVELVVW